MSKKPTKKNKDNQEHMWLMKKRSKDCLGLGRQLPLCAIDRKYKNIRKKQNNYANLVKLSRQLGIHPFTHRYLVY